MVLEQLWDLIQEQSKLRSVNREKGHEAHQEHLLGHPQTNGTHEMFVYIYAHYLYVHRLEIRDSEGFFPCCCKKPGLAHAQWYPQFSCQLLLADWLCKFMLQSSYWSQSKFMLQKSQDGTDIIKMYFRKKYVEEWLHVYISKRWCVIVLLSGYEEWLHVYISKRWRVIVLLSGYEHFSEPCNGSNEYVQLGSNQALLSRLLSVLRTLLLQPY